MLDVLRLKSILFVKGVSIYLGSNCKACVIFWFMKFVICGLGIWLVLCGGMIFGLKRALWALWLVFVYLNAFSMSLVMCGRNFVGLRIAGIMLRGRVMQVLLGVV